ncbi:hypothetical protein ZIOFF_017022 [Zingiber officinale]|uniref:Cell division cycle protein 123 n=2 Tax=Zingiber officinale TaxID=94328 RepID=A0A8J5HHU7_ZINOF|nr:hypothetical protein ZIOFF_017022 [Zingiber officinale]
MLRLWIPLQKRQRESFQTAPNQKDHSTATEEKCQRMPDCGSLLGCRRSKEGGGLVKACEVAGNWRELGACYVPVEGDQPGYGEMVALAVRCTGPRLSVLLDIDALHVIRHVPAARPSSQAGGSAMSKEAAKEEEEVELLRCQINEWYPKFKTHTIRTLFHPLPQPFIRYLLGLHPHRDAAGADDHDDGDDDGGDDASSSDAPPFLLPRPTSGRDPLPRPTLGVDPTSLLDCSQLSDDDEENEEADPAPSFPDLEEAVERSIASLGGAAFPKLNWSAPKDATWISADGTLRCSSFTDVALLLHSSDSVAHDLSSQPAASDSASSPFVFYLALRKWYPSLRPEMEFRCFVRHRRLVAISQREVTNFYPSLLDRYHRLLPLIRDLFSEVIRPGFESQNYTFDVYVTSDGRVKLIDFNPWRAFTLPLLFTWEELEEEAFTSDDEEEEEIGKEHERKRDVEFRIVESQCGVRPGLKTAVPYDYLDTGEGSGWDQFLKRADEELRKQTQSTSRDGDKA